MVAIGVADPPDPIERILVADVAAKGVTRVRRVHDQAAITHDFGGAPDQSHLGILGV